MSEKTAQLPPEPAWAIVSSICVGGLLIGLSIACVMLGFCDAAGAIDAGGDEHFELLKGYMTWRLGYARGVPWNDQPPLHTLLIGLVFSLSNGSLAVVRGTAVLASGLLLSGAAMRIGAPMRRSLLGIGVCTWLLVSAKATANLYFTPMLEIPAFGLALWGSHLFLQSRSAGGALAGGVLWSAAVGVKLTSLMMFPALIVIASLRLYLAGSPSRRKEIGRYFVFFGVIAILFCSWALYSGGGLFAALWTSHEKASLNIEAESHQFDLLRYMSTPLGIGVCLCLLFGRVLGLFSIDHGFEWVWLITALGVHSVHVPFWSYYDLHINIPAAILIGRALESLAKVSWLCDETNPYRRCVCASLCKLWIGFVCIASNLVAWVGELELVSERRRINRSVMIDTIGRETRTDDVVFCFSGMVNVVSDRISIPSISLRPAKRFWSGDLTSERVWSIVEEARPRGIVWSTSSELPANILRLLAAEYRYVCEEGGETLWIRDEQLKTDYNR
jgi:hypothetical protein